MGATISSEGEFWIAAVHVIAADDDVFQTFVAPFVRDVAGQFVVARGSGNVRLGGEDFMLPALFIRGGDGFELVFDFGLVGCGRRGEAHDGSLGVRKERRMKRQRQITQGAGE